MGDQDAVRKAEELITKAPPVPSKSPLPKKPITENIERKLWKKIEKYCWTIRKTLKKHWYGGTPKGKDGAGRRPSILCFF
jgi:hypothetical protein